MPDVDKAGEEDNGQWSTIVLNELPDVSVEELRVAHDATEVCAGRDEQGDHDAEIRRCGAITRCLPLASEHLNALLQIDHSNVEAKSIAAEPSNVGESVARISEGENPVHDQAPDADPGHEGKEIVALRCNNVVYGVREDCDGTGNADDAEWLAGEKAEDATSENGGEEDFVDAIGVVGLGEHI